MIHINLLPLKETQRAVGQRQQVSVALLSLSVAVLIMVVPYVIQSRKLSRLDDQIEGLKKELQQLSQQTIELRDLDKKKQELSAKLKVIDELNQKRVGPLQVLQGLSAAAPEKLWLNEFTETKGAANIIGMALDNQTIATFMRQLSQFPQFVNVDLVEAAQSDANRSGEQGAPVRLKRFTLKAGIDYVGQRDKPATPATGTPPGTAEKPKG